MDQASPATLRPPDAPAAESAARPAGAGAVSAGGSGPSSFLASLARVDRLGPKLFLAIAGANAVLAALAYLVFSVAFDRGFLEYLQRADQARIDTFVAALAAGYAREGSWDWAAADPTRWQSLYREALGLSRLVHAGGTGDARSSAIPPNPAREFPLTIEPRLLLFDAQRKLVAGREEFVDRAILKPVDSGGATVGYIGYIPRPQFIESIQRVFFAQQHGKFAAAAVGMLIAGVIVAAILSYWLTRRVRTVARGAAALMQGDYDVRVPVRGHDELAQLGRDFNRLAETLAATRLARQQWIADIAHELRTPLAVLRGEIEALQDGVRPLGPEGLASLEQETGRLSRLVEDLHALSRADLGALTYHKERIDLAELLQEFLHGQRRALQERGIALAISASEAMPVVGDEARLAQVFGNLLQNTLRYTDAPGRLDVTLLRVNGDIEIEWADSAPGVRAEDLPRLTDRLYRVEGSRSRASGGSGLGLAIAKAIVDAHHGSMVASASPLGGLRWSISLPAANAHVHG